MTHTLDNKNILLIISGGIAAYKSLELIRLLRGAGAQVQCILTKGGAQFVTPLSVSALAEKEVYTDLWSLKDETEMGHIRLSRDADLVIIAPASANLIAKTANGFADDLASTTLLASNTPIMIAPAMNVAMWNNAATQKNIQTLRSQGAHIVGPDSGEMACGEFGPGRMSEPTTILETIKTFFFDKPLKGRKAILTAGPTYEPIDPVRYIGNHSSGKQGYAIAEALSQLGADVTIIAGPNNQTTPSGVKTIHITTATEMLQAAQSALPADIFIGAAAICDWRAKTQLSQKLKKDSSSKSITIELEENPDILKSISEHDQRPQLVIGFAAETQNLIPNAQKKLTTKGCDWVLANDVSEQKVFGQNENHVHLVSNTTIEDWGPQSKKTVAETLAKRIADHVTAPHHKQDIKNAAE